VNKFLVLTVNIKMHTLNNDINMTKTV